MNKQEFIKALREKLSSFPKKEVEERVAFYAEGIEDRMEEGLSEEEAVAKMGSVEAVALEIAREIPLLKAFQQKIKPSRKLQAWEIVLLVIGSPIWLSLLLSAAAVLLSLYVSIWSVVVSLWAGFLSVAASVLAGAVGGIALLCLGKIGTGVAFFAVALICIGLTIFFFYASKSVTKAAVLIAKNFGLAIKKRAINKGEAK